MAFTKPFDTCVYCNRVCEFKISASAIIKSQIKWVINVLSYIRLGNFGSASRIALIKAAEALNEPPSPMDMDQRGLAYCLMAHIIHELNLNSELKDKIMKYVKKVLIYAFKSKAKAEGLPIKIERGEDALESKEVTSTSSDNVSEGSEEPSAINKKELTKDQIDQQNLAEARRRIREQKMGLSGKKKSPVESMVGANTWGKKLYQWLISDKKLAKILLPQTGIKPISNGFIITFNPESEGYLSSCKLQYAVKSINLGDDIRDVVKIRVSGVYDIKYNMDMAIGSGKKGMIGVSFFKLPKNRDEILDALKNTSKKNINEWDTLMLIINNDKSLLKMISKLPLKAPLPNIDNILIPVSIKHSKENMQTQVTCFYTPKLKPSFLIIDVLDGIVADIDNLGDIDESKRGKSAADSGLFEFNAPEFDSDNFHFIETNYEPIQVRTCPNCGRPLPDPNAEYRRCPYCLYKLM